MQGLHAAQTAAHDCGKFFDAEIISQANLRIHPVLNCNKRKVSAVGFASFRVGAARAGRAKARTQVIHADYKKPIGVKRLARSHHVVPPALTLVLPFVQTRHMMRGIQCVAHQHSIAFLGIQGAIGFNHQRIAGQGLSALK